MSGITITFDTGQLDILVGDLSTAPSRVEIYSHEAVRKAALAIRREAKALVPQPGHNLSGRSTGRLKQSIYFRTKGLSGFVRANTPYADYVEYGTSEMAPEPFMRPAAEVGFRVLEEEAARAGENAILG
jgi:HK97 gp10 family phage protein